MLLIADVAALTGVPSPQLRSWEDAGVLHPRRSPNAVRLYGVEDVAQVRLIKRSLQNPGRRGSLRRLAKELASGTLAPAPEDYVGLVPAGASSLPITDAMYWHSVVDAMVELVVVCDTTGAVTSMNPALRVLLSESEGPARLGRSVAGKPLPAALEALPLRWAALTGTQHHDLELVLARPGGINLPMLWNVTPFRDSNGALRGAVGVGRVRPQGTAIASDDWLPDAVHDLRVPVSTILGRLQLARRVLSRLRVKRHSPDADQADQLDKHLVTAEVSTRDLIRMMETLMDTFAAANDALVQQLEPEGVDLAELARETIDHAQRSTSQHAIVLDAPPGSLLVAGDRARLRQVFENLLNNAIKYSPDGGPVVVRLEMTDTLPMLAPSQRREAVTGSSGMPSWAVVRIEDHGLGIPAEAVAWIFDRYWRADAVKHQIRGTGLGLYACRAILTAHGGHIWVERTLVEAEASSGDWHGTVIAFVLPCASASHLLDGTRGAGRQVSDASVD
jgi:signal transduction histidine kinase